MAAGPVGAVEGEVPGRQVLEGPAVAGAREMLAEHDGPGLHRLAVLVHLAVAWKHLDLRNPLGQGQRRLHRLGEATFQAVAQHQAVDHHLDRVHLVTGQVHLVAQVVRLAVHDHTAESLRRQVRQQGVVGALAATHHRCEDLEPGALLHFEYPVHDLLRGLSNEAFAGLRIVRHADPGVEQAKVVVDLGDGPDGGTGVARRALLVDRDRR